MQAIVEPIDSAARVESLLPIVAGMPEPAILESSSADEAYGRCSIFACDPVEVWPATEPPAGCPFDRLRERVERYPKLEHPPETVPLAGGWVGFLGYEAGLVGKRVRPRFDRACGLPLLRFALYDSLLIRDHGQRQWFATAIDWPEGTLTHRAPAAVRLRRLRSTLQQAEHTEPATPSTPSGSRPIANMSEQSYYAKVRGIQDYIAAGDVYQVNLTHRLTVRTDGAPLDLYLRLRSLSPSSYAALLAWDDAAVISSSPELFLDLRHGRVVTRPIKGTRPRSDDPVVDAALRAELWESEKEQAELNMIVDLLRNDLGRVCSFGSVRVVDPAVIEDHPTVFHRVGTIEGRLAPGRDWADLLRATLPGGSITGAPKLRAMQIIRELEPTPRGVYCGSIGWVGLDGSMCLNVAIRTMVWQANTVNLYAGGAIVADSDPRQEYEEVAVKYRAMLRSLGCGSLTDGARCAPAKAT